MHQNLIQLKSVAALLLTLRSRMTCLKAVAMSSYLNFLVVFCDWKWKKARILVLFDIFIVVDVGWLLASCFCSSFLFALSNVLSCSFSKTQYISVTVSGSKDAALLPVSVLLLSALHSLGLQKNLIYCLTVAQPWDILVALTVWHTLKNGFNLIFKA